MAITCGAGAATASTITYDIKFSASNFVAPPVSGPSTVQGEFHITLDPADYFNNETSGLIVDSLNIVVDGAVAYRHWGSEELDFGGTSGGGVCCGDGLGHDFLLSIRNLTTSPFISLFVFADGSGDLHIATVTSLQVSSGDIPTPTPLPATLPLLASAIGSLGFLGWRRGKPAARSRAGVTAYRRAML